MTRLIVLILASLAVGCASQSQSTAVVPLRSTPGPASTALAFTPTIARDISPADLDLDRDGRGVYAAAGYESNVLSVTYTRTDDDQRYYAGNRGRGGGDDSRYERRSISTSVTVRGH